MEGLSSKAKRQILADFSQKNRSQRKHHTYQHFSEMGYMKTIIYQVMRHVDAGESLAQQEGQGRPWKQGRSRRSDSFVSLDQTKHRNHG